MVIFYSLLPLIARVLCRYCLIIFLLCNVSLSAQRLHQISGVEVDRSGHALADPWTGGYNNPVVSPIDLDQDGLMDLFIFDKAASKAQAFINIGSVGHPSYRYAPEYDIMFPEGMTDWALIRDFNKDGVPDIFALYENINISVWQGSRVAGGGLSFIKLIDMIPYTYGAAGHDWIYAMIDNMPIIADVDNDGDMDIIAPDVTGTRIQYFVNRSEELGYGSDSLIFILGDRCWGGIYENSGCSVSYAPCKTNDLTPPQRPAAGQRDNGGAMYGFDYEGDHDVDVLLSDVACNTIKFLRNDGDSLNCVIGYGDSLFPSYDRSVKMSTFPAAYGADVDNDGYTDMLIAPFAINSNYIMKSEDVKCLQYYQNDGATPPLNRFHYLGDTLLTPNTVDVGTESHAVFFDYNGDGLMDIVVGNFGRFRANPSLTLYENTGTITTPKYNEAALNWSNISAFNLTGVYPAFGDMDGDGHADMVIAEQTGQLHYFQNAGTTTASYPAMTGPDWFNINAGRGPTPFIYDLNGDGLNDLIIGSTDGTVRYYWNFGTLTTPQFSSDSVNLSLGNVRVTHTPTEALEYSSPAIHRGNGALFLYSGSREGHIERYLVNTDSLRQGTFARLSADVTGINPGGQSTVSVADINGDGLNDYLTGNVRGGLMLFSDAYWGNGISLPTSVIEQSYPDNAIQIYPVPARDLIQCRFTAGSGRLVAAQLYDLIGKCVNAPVSDDGKGLTVSVGSQPEGIYIIRLTDDMGKTYQQKVSVVR